MAAQPSPISSEMSGEDALRADLYAFLSVLLARPPHGDLLASTAALTGDDSEIGQGIATLARLAARRSVGEVAREFNALFIGLGRGELIPHASYYLTGFLHEKPLARLRADMGRLGIARADGVAEPEDGIAALCEMMAGLIRGAFDGPAELAAQRAFYEAHLAPWAGHFFADLEGAKGSVFYAPVGRIGRLFMEVEREAFRMEEA